MILRCLRILHLFCHSSPKQAGWLAGHRSTLLMLIRKITCTTFFFWNIADVVWGDRTDRRLTDSSTNRMTQTVSECYESRRESQRERDSRVPLGSSDVPRFELFPYGLVWPSFVIIIILSSLTLPCVSCVFFIVYSRFILFLAMVFFYARIFYLLALLHNKANKRMQALCFIHALRSRHHAMRSHAK